MDSLKINQLMTRSTELKDAMRKQEEENRKKLQAMFTEAMVDAFEAFPTVYAFYWLQYTPYWNDGEECEFKVHGHHALTEEHLQKFKLDSELEDCETSDEILASEEYGLEEYGWSSYYLGRWYNKAAQDKHFADAPEGLRGFISFLYGLPNDLYLSVFGNHAKVVITRQGTTITEYEHD